MFFEIYVRTGKTVKNKVNVLTILFLSAQNTGYNRFWELNSMIYAPGFPEYDFQAFLGPVS